MSSPVITTDSLTKYYGPICGIENVTHNFPEGGVGLLGANGAGKTTLIRTLLGIIRPTRGNATILGYNIKTDINQIRDLIGYMPEFNTSFVPDSTAMKFVSFCGRMNGLSNSESKQRASDSLYYVGLGEERYRKLETFSLGMKQKVKLAIALVHDPHILICDEPTNGLDPKGRVQMLNLLRDLQINHNKNIILSSHLLRDVEQTTSHAVVISKGQILMGGNITELTKGKQSTISVRIKTRANEHRFIEELESRGLKAYKDRTFIEIDRAHENIENRIFQTAAESGIEIRYLGSRSSTLEDVFLDLFQNQEGIQ
jgi:ABC-2 type transport system ATP-binding protein